MPRSRSRGRSASRPGREWRRVTAYEPVIGLEIHVQLRTRTKMFCGCELSFGDDPNVHTCQICLAHPGHAAGPERAGDRATALQIGAGARLRDRPAVDLPPQELLLSRQPEGVPDQPVRHPARLRRPARRRPHPPRPPRGGRGEARSTSPNRAASMAPAPSLVDFNRGGTPLRRDRHRARHPRRRDGARVAAAAADDGPPDRRLRRQHGGGEPALRREHLAPARRQRRARGRRPSSRT